MVVDRKTTAERGKGCPARLEVGLTDVVGRRTGFKPVREYSFRLGRTGTTERRPQPRREVL